MHASGKKTGASAAAEDEDDEDDEDARRGRRADDEDDDSSSVHDPLREHRRKHGLEDVQKFMNKSFPKFATEEWLKKFVRTGVETLDDFTYLVDDDEDDLEDLELSRDEAKQLQHAVREELMRRFLHAVPYPGEPNGHFEKFLGGLLEAGLDEIEDLEDLEDDLEDEEALKALGMTRDEAQTLSVRAEEHEARQVLTLLVTTHQAADGPFPFKAPAVHNKMIEAFVATGIETLEDLLYHGVDTPILGRDGETVTKERY